MTEEQTPNQKKALGAAFIAIGVSMTVTFGLTLGVAFIGIGLLFVVLGLVFLGQNKTGDEPGDE